MVTSKCLMINAHFSFKVKWKHVFNKSWCYGNHFLLEYFNSKALYCCGTGKALSKSAFGNISQLISLKCDHKIFKYHKFEENSIYIVYYLYSVKTHIWCCQIPSVYPVMLNKHQKSFSLRFTLKICRFSALNQLSLHCWLMWLLFGAWSKLF